MRSNEEMFSLRGFTVLISCAVLLIVQSSYGSEIIGGNEVEPHSLPFMALLETKTPACGGVLIEQSWVLTAAHCIKDSLRRTMEREKFTGKENASPRTASIKKVLLGVHSIKGDKKDSRQVRKVKTSFPHPCFDNTDKVNDLMLLKLDKPVKKTKTVNWLKLAKTSKEPAAGSTCVVAGWGTTTDNAKQMSDVLRSVNVTVIDRVKCNSPDYYNLKPVITRSMICAGSNGKKPADTCGGDSGGPLLCNGVLAGITSFGVKCGIINKPGVYAFLSEKQLKWIKKTMNT